VVAAQGVPVKPRRSPQFREINKKVSDGRGTGCAR